MSGRSGSKISLAQNRVIISRRPAFSMEWVIAGRDVHDLIVLPRTRYSLISSPQIVPKADDGVAFEHEELLGLYVVVVIAAGDPRPRPRHEYLAEVRRFQQLRQRAAGVGA